MVAIATSHHSRRLDHMRAQGTTSHAIEVLGGVGELGIERSFGRGRSGADEEELDATTAEKRKWSPGGVCGGGEDILECMGGKKGGSGARIFPEGEGGNAGHRRGRRARKREGFGPGGVWE